VKICVTAAGNTLDAPVDPRFGRAAYFAVINSENMAFRAIPNVAVNAMGGAGIQAAQKLAKEGVNVVITGNVGPNAFQALKSAGLKVVVGASGTVREIVVKYTRGELGETDAPTVDGHFGNRK